MRRISMIPALLLVFPAVLGAQGNAARTGSIAGDVYLLTQGGDVKRGAANEVLLFRSPAHLEEKYAAVCATQSDSFLRQQQAVSSLLVSSPPSGATPEESLAWGNAKVAALQAVSARLLEDGKRNAAERRALLHSGAWRTSPTGMNAHYSFVDVPSGRYTLVAAMGIGGDIEDWFLPISILAGQHLSVDLDNTNIYGNNWSCDVGPPVK